MFFDKGSITRGDSLIRMGFTTVHLRWLHQNTVWIDTHFHFVAPIDGCSTLRHYWVCKPVLGGA